MRRSVQRWTGAAAVVWMAVGCRPRGEAVEPTAPVVAAAGPTPVGSGRHRGASPAVAVATSPVQLLPDSAKIVFTAAGLMSVLTLVDVDALIGKYRPFYEQAAAELMRMLGVNLLDPTQWSSAGIDVNGAMGVALADMPSETFVAFVTLTDRDKFRAFLDKASGGTLVPVLEDRGVVLKTEPDATSSVVLRDGYAFMVSTGRPARAAYDHARSLATIDPARGLTGTERYRAAMASPEPPRPLTAYVDVWGLIEAEAGGGLSQKQADEASWIDAEVERAQASGAPPEELQRLRMQQDAERQWQEQRRQQKLAQYEVLSRWFGAVEPLVFEFTASAAGVVGRVRARMPETSVWRSVFRNAATPSPVLQALGERPVFLVGGSVDPLQAQAVIEDLMRADGDDPNKQFAEFTARTTIDVRRELTPILAGTGGFALTVSSALARGEAKYVEKELGFAAALAVHSPERAQALVDRAVGKLPGVKVGRDRKTGAYALEIPNYRTVHAGVVAGHIVVTSDAGVFPRMNSGSQGLAKLISKEAVPVVTTRDTAGQMMFDLLYPVMLFMGRRSGAWDSQRPEPPYSAFPDVERAKIDKVPLSRAYKAKLREWDAVDGKIKRETEAEEKRQARAIAGMSEAFGAQAWHLRELPDGLVVEGGHLFGRGGLTRAIDLVVDYVGQAQRSEKVWELYGTRAALESELMKIRVAEVAAALGVASPLVQ